MKKIILIFLFCFLSLNLFAGKYDLSFLKQDNQQGNKQEQKENQKYEFDFSSLKNNNNEQKKWQPTNKTYTEKLKDFFDPEKNIFVGVIVFLLLITFIFVYPIQILILIIGLLFHLFKDKRNIKYLLIPYGFIYILKNRYKSLASVKQDLQYVIKYAQSHITNILLIIIIILLIVCLTKISNIQNDVYDINSDISDIKDKISDLENDFYSIDSSVSDIESTVSSIENNIMFKHRY